MKIKYLILLFSACTTTLAQDWKKEYAEVRDFKNGLAVVKKKYAQKQTFVTKDTLSEYYEFFNQELLMEDPEVETTITDTVITYKYGVVNQKGKIVIPVEYDGIDDFLDKDFTRVYKNVIPPDAKIERNRDIRTINRDYYTAMLPEFKTMYGFINKKGKIIVPLGTYENVDWIQEGIAFVEQKGKWGAINAKGKVVIPFIYDNRGSTHKGKISIGYNDKYGLIDKKGKTLLPFEYDLLLPILSDDKENLYHISLNGKPFLLDFNTKKKVPLSKKYAFIGELKDGLMEVFDFDYNQGYIDKTGKEVIPCVYGLKQIEKIDANTFKVPHPTKKNEYQFINRQGECFKNCD